MEIVMLKKLTLLFITIHVCAFAEEYTVYVTTQYLVMNKKNELVASYLIMKKQSNGTLAPFNTTIELTQEPPANIIGPLPDDPDKYRFIESDEVGKILTEANKLYVEMMEKIDQPKYFFNQTLQSYLSDPTSSMLKQLDINDTIDYFASTDTKAIQIVLQQNVPQFKYEQILKKLKQNSFYSIGMEDMYKQLEHPTTKFQNMAIDQNYVKLFADMAQKTIDALEQQEQFFQSLEQDIESLGGLEMLLLPLNLVALNNDFSGLLAVLQ